MTYAIEHYCLRTLGLDDAEALHHYERVNRDFLQPWEPERDEHYFTLNNARARVEQQLESMAAGARSALFWSIPSAERCWGGAITPTSSGVLFRPAIWAFHWRRRCKDRA